MENLYTEEGFDANQISVVLVNTSHPGNIGAAARGMKNMGLKRLVLVNPKDFPSGAAIARAAAAVDVIENAVVVETLEEAVNNCALVIGASARSRKIPWPMLDPNGCAEKVLSEHHENKVALVFGREDSGLNNEELQLCHYHVQIPSNPECPSLNLATAVMVISYEIAKLRTKTKNITVPKEDDFWDQPKSTIDDLERFYEHLERVLIAVRFHDPENPRQLMQRMRRLFGRIRVDEMEMNVLRGILSNVEWHIDRKNQ
ncbi:MAG: tRNA (cytosine(32)/uridine(32)-2'-O)-methyltransferase TrmJ [Gammaproteobacteria bacterium]|nr:tRNA (cytosine(32)/uridine(32)-2'-O)-methyltransferase TrmJ [Gammaproteobacteria bacterium]